MAGIPPTTVVVQSTDSVTKEDLSDAKDDLRREMKLWLGCGSALGTTLSGALAAYVGRNSEPMHTAIEVARTLIS